ERLFEFFMTSQVVLASLDGHVTKLGGPALVERAEPSPDGKYVLVERVLRPYSYLVPVGRFPRVLSLWNTANGSEQEILGTRLAESVPQGHSAVPVGPRHVGWRADAPATIYWVEAQDGGDPKKTATVRDKLFVRDAATWPVAT